MRLLFAMAAVVKSQGRSLSLSSSHQFAESIIYNTVNNNSIDSEKFEFQMKHPFHRRYTFTRYMLWLN